jgi:peroxiredoxin
MTVRIGDPVPDAPVQTLDNNGLATVSVATLARDGRLVLFAVPGAFTPACSARHLPGFVEHAADFKAKGVATLACIAVNDAFVMAAWGRTNQANEHVRLLGDGNALFTRAMGLEQDSRPLGMGMRSRRYAMVAERGRITHLFVEEPGAFEISAAPHVLAHI